MRVLVCRSSLLSLCFALLWSFEHAKLHGELVHVYSPKLPSAISSSGREVGAIAFVALSKVCLGLFLKVAR